MFRRPSVSRREHHIYYKISQSLREVTLNSITPLTGIIDVHREAHGKTDLSHHNTLSDYFPQFNLSDHCGEQKDNLTVKNMKLRHS